MGPFASPFKTVASNHPVWASFRIPLLFLLLVLAPRAAQSAELIHSGQIASDETWSSADTHLVQGTVSIPTGLTLTIEAGTQVGFDDATSLTVDGGTLLIQGTGISPVVLNSTVTGGGVGNWQGIVVNSGSITIDQAQISNFTSQGISLASGSLGIVRDSVIDSIDGDGSCISVTGSSPTLQGNTLTNCSTGLRVEGTANPLVNGNNLITQNTFGIFLYAGSFNEEPGGEPFLDWTPKPIINQNQIINNSSFNFGFSFPWGGFDLNTPIDVKENWWGTTNVTDIQVTIYDGNDESGFLPFADISGYLDAPNGTPATGNTLVGNIAANMTLPAGTTYTVLSDLKILSDATLTIEAGVQILFPDTFWIEVAGGGMLVQGTAQSPVVFDSATAQGGTGNWGGIHVNYGGMGGNASFTHAQVINFSGSGISFDADTTGQVLNSLVDGVNGDGSCVSLTGSSPAIQGTTLTRCSNGLYLEGAANPLVDGDSQIIQNTYGVYSTAQLWGANYLGPQPVINDSQLSQNSSYNYFLTSNWSNVANYQQIVLNAQGNWWGSAVAADINASIFDSADSATLPTVDITGFLLSAGGGTDTVAPVITAVSGPDEIRSGVLEVQATDNVGVDRVEFQLDTVALSSTVTATGYSTEFDFAQMTEGAHVLSYTVFDVNQNSVSGSVNLNVDFQPPPAPVIVQPANNSSTGNSQITVSGTADPRSLVLVDVDSDTAITPIAIGVAGQETVVEIFVDSVSAGAPVAVNASGQFAQLITLSGTQGILTAHATTRGGVSGASQAVTVTVDQSGPVISAVTYSGVALDAATITQSDSIVVDTNDPNGVSRVEFVLDGGANVIDTNAADGYALPLVVEQLAVGAHSLVVTSFDSYDNATQLTVSFTVAAEPPPAPVINSPGTGLITNKTSVIVTGSTEPNLPVMLYVNNVASAQSVTASSTGGFQGSVTISEGVNSITATATGRGGESAQSAPVSVTLDSSIPLAPNLTVTTGQGGEITLNWNAITADPVISGYRVYRADVAFTDVASASEVNSGLITGTTFTDLPNTDGEYYYRVLAENSLGTTSPLSNQVLGTVDSTGPRAVSIEYTPAGQYDVISGRMAPGNVQVNLQVSEALLTTPFLSITPQAGIPIAVNLTKTSDTSYSGSFEITDSTPTGTAYAVFSARDLIGNRGTSIDAGGSIKIDTDGPAVTQITISPAEPIQNDSNAPVTVNVDIDLDDDLPAGFTATLAYSLSSSSPTDTGVSNLALTAARHWAGSFVLPADAGLAAPESLQFSFSATDDLGNVSNTIVGKSSFQVYQGNLPPLGYPSGLSAVAMPGGDVQLSWNQVTDASDYQLYRQAPGETALLELVRSGNVASYVDQTGGNGLYRYAIASVRSVNSQESVSSSSPSVEVNADATIPAAPLNLALELVSNGILASWEDPSADADTRYSLYRSSATEILSVDGLTPVLENIVGLAIVDTTPSQDEHTYAVTAVDPAGNESAPSTSVYLNFGLLPVASLSVVQDQDAAPVLSWSHSAPASIAGYNLFVGESGALTGLNSTPLTQTSYTDNGFNGDERRYTIVGVDANDVSSLERSVLLPELSAELQVNTQLSRGIMNRLSYVVTNNGTRSVDNIVVRASIDLHGNESQSFSLLAGESKTADVVLGGYQDLAGLSTLESTIKVVQSSGEEVNIIRRQDQVVSDAALTVNLATRDFTRGGTGQVQVTVENTSDVEIEVETASANGTQPSTDIRFKLIDIDGNVLNTQSFNQALSGNVVTLSSGKTVARIPAGTSFISDWFDLVVPSSSPDNIEVRLEIDRLHYHLGKTDAESIDVGLQASQQVYLIETTYFGELSSVTPASSFGDQDIVISGRAVNRLSAQAEFNVPLKLVIAANGFERLVDLQTDVDGNFSYSFTPLPGESGIYTVSVIHPDILERPQQGQFTISRISVSPAQANLHVPRNSSFPGTFAVTAGNGTTATNVRLEFNAADQPSGTLPTGINVTLPPSVNLNSGEKAVLEVQIGGDLSAADTGSLVLTLKSDETLDANMGTVTVNYQFSEAQPFLGFSPAHLQTGVVHNDNVTESFMLENKGLTPLENLSLQVLSRSGTPAPVWVQLMTYGNLGTLAVGDQREVQINVAPNDTVDEGLHEFKLRASSDNFTTTDIPFTVTVTQSGIGNVLFKVADIYTATFDEVGELIEGVELARIKLINDNVITIEYNLSTDTTGEAYFTDVPAGLYRYRISADNHQDKTGQVYVKPGMTVAENAFLDYNLVTVEWSVNEITIQDIYEITLQATYKTDVPAAVVVGDPVSITLPDMQPGDVFYGEFTLTNHGLIRADNLTVQLPPDDQFFDYEIMGGLPDFLEAKQVLTVPYRIVSLQALSPDGTTTGGGCSSYNACGSSKHCFTCANGSKSCGSTPNCFGKSSGGASGCGGGDGYDGGVGGIDGSFGGTGVTAPVPDESGVPSCRPSGDGRECGGSGNGNG